MNYQTLKINHIETEVCFSSLASICAECLGQVQTLDLRSRVVRSALDFVSVCLKLHTQLMCSWASVEFELVFPRDRGTRKEERLLLALNW